MTQEIPQSESDRSAVELLLKEKKLEEAITVLSKRLAENPLEREISLCLLIANIELHGPEPYEQEIDDLRSLTDFDQSERILLQKIFLLGHQAAEKQGREDKAWAYQRLLRRLLLGLPLDQSIPIDKAQRPPPDRERTSLKDAVVPVVPVSTDSPTRSAFAARARMSFDKKSVRQVGLALAAAGVLVAPVAYFVSGAAGVKTQSVAEVMRESPPRSAETTPLAVKPQSMKPDNSQQDRLHRLVAEQLSNLRRVYSRWSERNRSLKGSMLLKLTIDPDGKVVRVDDLGSRLTDAGFIKVVINEARKWRFPKGRAEAAEVTIPLLFVPRGIDPATVVKWEGTLKAAPEKQKLPPTLKVVGTSSGVKNESDKGSKPSVSISHRKDTVTPSSKPGELKSSSATLAAYKTKRPVSLREEPRFAAARVQEVDGGAQVKVLEVTGDWLKVRAQHSGAVGFVRKEFVDPIN